MPQYNPFNINKGRPLNRFVFDVSDGVILPGDVVVIPFVFKSPNAGIFTETWKLETLPVLCGSENIIVTLHGVATQCDEYEQERRQLEAELESAQNRVMCRRILMSVLASIKTPERPSSPVNTNLTEEEMFRENNSDLHFRTEAIAKLKQFHQEFEPEDDWDMNLKSLIKNVESLEDEDTRETAYQRVNEDIKELSVPIVDMAPTTNYDAAYLILCHTFDQLSARARKLGTAFGLPEKELVIKSSELSTKKSKANSVDTSKQSKMDAKTNKKDGGGKKGGKQEKGGKKDAGNANAKQNETAESESVFEVVDRSVNNSYMDKLYVEVYNCLSDMAVNLESVLSK